MATEDAGRQGVAWVLVRPVAKTSNTDRDRGRTGVQQQEMTGLVSHVGAVE